MFVIVHALTGIWYGTQYGGTATREAWAEGYLVPVDGRQALAGLERIFVGTLRGTGIWGGDVVVTRELLDQIQGAVSQVRFWPASTPSLQGEQPPPVPLQLDQGRLADLDEAWIPVLTLDGPGILVWSNSD
jgi:hypothetical protein